MEQAASHLCLTIVWRLIYLAPLLAIALQEKDASKMASYVVQIFRTKCIEGMPSVYIRLQDHQHTNLKNLIVVLLNAIQSYTQLEVKTNKKDSNPSIFVSNSTTKSGKLSAEKRKKIKQSFDFLLKEDKQEKRCLIFSKICFMIFIFVTILRYKLEKYCKN